MANVSERGARVGMYYRVSSKEHVDGYSLDAQVRSIEAHCAQHRWEVVARYPEPAKSARTDDVAKRPAFKQMLEDAEAGHFDVLVVHKLDRFARNLRVQLETFGRLERAGVAFVSVSEQMDLTTPQGRFQMALMGGFAHFYSDNLAQETKKGKAERKAQGLYNGVLPFGAAKGPGGVPVLDAAPRPVPGGEGRGALCRRMGSAAPSSWPRPARPTAR